MHLNFWDFAGQDLYHNTHRLFLENNALYVICGTDRGDGFDPDGDKQDEKSIGDDERRNLKYWIDQVQSLGHDQKSSNPVPIVLVRTKTDRDREPPSPPLYWEEQSELAAEVDEFPKFDFSAATGEGKDELLDWLKQNAAKVLGTIDQRSLAARPMEVKTEIQRMKIANEKSFANAELHQIRATPPYTTMTREEFHEIVRRYCSDGHYFDNPMLLLRRLHLSGFLYYNAKQGAFPFCGEC